jgi:uncharacterized membrane protein YhhN
MSYILYFISLIIAAIDWIAVAKKYKPVEYFAKPAVMISLLIWVLQSGGNNSFLIWFELGIVFSLAGDLFLMLPKERFLAGLISFLLAHICYLTGFSSAPPPINFASIVLAVIILITSLRIYRRILENLTNLKQGSLKIPILLYTTVISLMLYSALITLVREDWPVLSAIIVSIGALLFYISDVFLAWSKFITPLPHAKLRVIITYHLGQALIALGAVLYSVQY